MNLKKIIMKKIKPILFFVDNNLEEVSHQWKKSNLSWEHEMIEFTPFVSIQETLDLIKKNEPTIIVVAYYLDGVTNGVQIVQALENGGCEGIIITNTGDNGAKLFRDTKVIKHAGKHPFGLYSAVENIKTEDFRRMSYQKNLENFEESVKNEDYELALRLIGKIKGYGYVENYVHIALDENVFRKSPEFISKVLRYFVDQREDICSQHGYWVHSVSHFYSQLWKLGMKKETREFSKISINGALELGDSNCLSRLLGVFFKESSYDDNPDDFGINEKVISLWGHPKEYEKARIKTKTFINEYSYLSWQLIFADCPVITSFTSEYQLGLIDKKNVCGLIERLRKIDPDYPLDSEIVFKKLYKKQYERLEKELKEELGGDKHEATVQKLRVALKMTESFL